VDVPERHRGGKVVAGNPDFSVHVIEDRSIAVQGPVTGQAFTMPGSRAKSYPSVRSGKDPIPWT